MPTCGYKKIFLKDLAAIPKRYRSRIERLVFDEIPASENIFTDFDVSRMKGFENYWRIRSGQYRIGIKIAEDNTIIFYRVRSREEIYRVFP
ncbi:MAG TPA: type II toxin-antitoxin system RelE/ParE family toxin [Methanoregula sp.]|nr:type II toxin-antitoxin system RelE/ParE family toxin [Methanoregula sp.]